ncbi:MAG: hypothetical protein ABFS42_09835 [Candidatus Krumholzibacteriota bacterium]
MRNLILTLILATMAVPTAQAVVDPGPDGIGVYFDLDADITETVMTPSIPFAAYVILTNPTRAEIHAVSFSFTIVVPAGMESSLFRLSHEVIFSCIDPALDFHPLYGNVQCGGDIPVPGSPTVILLRWQFVLLSTIPVDFFLGQINEPGPIPLAYESEAGWVPMYVSSGDPALPVAKVNGTGVVPLTSTSFGNLKALYR